MQTSIEMPPTYLHSRVVKGYTTWNANRRQSEWDDHGETYPMTIDGPDLFFNIEVPEGLFVLSLYDFNKDGHTGMNRFRDYHVFVKDFPPGRDLRTWCTADNQSYLDGLDEQPVLARFRISRFWGGAYKRLLVRGPAPLTLKIARNYSFNTIVCGVFLDQREEKPDPYFQRPKATRALLGEEGRSAISRGANDAVPAMEERLLADLESARIQSLSWWAEGSRGAYGALMRGWKASESGAPQESMPRWASIGLACYRLGLFEEWEACLQKQGLRTSRSIEKAIRWDGVSYSCRGAGRFFVQAVISSVGLK